MSPKEKEELVRYRFSKAKDTLVETEVHINTLNKAQILLKQADPESLDFDMYRSACIKEFEIILEQSGKLLRKTLKPYFHSSKAVDKLIFKDVFRHAVLRNIITDEACER